MFTPQDLYLYLQNLGITYTTYEHEPILTVEESLRIGKHLPPFGHCKNLFLKDKRKQFWLVSALAHTKIRMKELGKELEAPELRFANAEELMHYLGVSPGSVTLFGIINDKQHKVNIVLDSAIFEQERVGFHPLINRATTVVSPKDLIKFVESCSNNLRMITFIQSDAT